MNNKIVTQSNNISSSKSLPKQNIDNNSKPLIEYEFTGGKYPVLVFFESLLLIFAVITFYLLCTLSDSNTIFQLSGIPKTIYLSLCIGCIIACVISIIYAIIMYISNRGTKFQIYENSVSGIGLVKDLNNSLVKFELNYSQIDVVSIQWGCLNLSSNGTVFQIMLTSRDFRNNFRNIITQVIEPQKYMKDC